MLTVEDLRRELPEEVYQDLTRGDDTIAERALARAEVWIVSQFTREGMTPDFEDQIVREAWLKRALYELYCFVDRPDLAEAYREDARDLLSAFLGKEGEKGGEEKVVAVKVRSGEPTGLAREFQEAFRR